MVVFNMLFVVVSADRSLGSSVILTNCHYFYIIEHTPTVKDDLVTVGYAAESCRL